jgi:hypothetical protein
VASVNGSALHGGKGAGEEGAAAGGGQAAHGQAKGKAVQVDPIEPTLKPPGTERLKLKYEKLFSSFAFERNLRRYKKEEQRKLEAVRAQMLGKAGYEEGDEVGVVVRTST